MPFCVVFDDMSTLLCSAVLMNLIASNKKRLSFGVGFFMMLDKKVRKTYFVALLTIKGTTNGIRL